MYIQDTFKRYEIKYILTKHQKEQLQEAIAEKIRPDEYGRSLIYNIYYDTPEKYLIRRSLEKPIYKEKLRLRSYGVATSNTKVFLELKKKYKDVVYKRRITLEERDAMSYLQKQAALPKQSQIGNEIDYFCKLYNNLEPSVVLSYEREAFYAIEDASLRITFDQNICWRTDNFSLCQPSGGYQILEPEQSLMEIKTAGAMPLWLVHTLTKLAIYKTSFSKYGAAYMQMKQGL